MTSSLSKTASKRRFSLVQWAYTLLNKRLTATGRVFVVLMLLFGLGGSISLEVPLYIPWSFFAVLLLTALLAATRPLPKLHIARQHILPVSAGNELVYTVELENKSSRTAHRLTLEEWHLPSKLRLVQGTDKTFIFELQPGEKKNVYMRMYCPKRGTYTLRNLVALSNFPFGIWNRSVHARQESSFLVYPAFQPLLHFEVPDGRQYQPGGILLSSQVGESSEFMHTREYNVGDNPRHIHWASWARQNKPIIKVYQEEYFVRLALLLDNDLSGHRGDNAFECALSTAASIADVLSRQEYLIDLFAAGEEVHHFQAGRALAHFNHILEILACMQPHSQSDWQKVAAAILPNAPKLTALIAIFLDWDEDRKRLIDKMHALRLSTRVLVIKEGQTRLPIPKNADYDILQLQPNQENSSKLQRLRGQR